MAVPPFAGVAVAVDGLGAAGAAGVVVVVDAAVAAVFAVVAAAVLAFSAAFRLRVALAFRPTALFASIKRVRAG